MSDFLEDAAARILTVAAIILGLLFMAAAAALGGFMFTVGALLAMKASGVI